MPKTTSNRKISGSIKQIHMIAAIGRRGQIGLGGEMPWRNAADLGWFKETTAGSAVIIGRRTLEHMPTLIGREVFSFDSTMEPDALIAHASSGPYRNQPIFIAGGAYVYRAFAPFVNGLRLINHIDYDGEADAWFPFDAYGIPQLSGNKT